MPSPTPLITAALAATAVLAGHALAVQPHAQAAPAACASGPGYTVVEGDSWYALAREAGVATTALLDANDATESTVIRPGDQLCLPAGTTAPASWARRACGDGSAHTVAAGDSWFGIARRAGVSAGAVLAANGADESRVLHPGESICLPAGARPVTDPSDADTSGTGASGSPAAAAMEALPLHGPCWFGDTWGAPRGGGRRHQGVDLITFSGRYVYAVTDGVLSRRAWDQPGLLSGNAWWLTADDGSGTYYFYAHLSDFAPGLEVGSRVEAGQIIGFVGSTGSSSTPHLHFEIHPGGGEAVNPYPSLAALGGCKTGSGYPQPGGWTPSTAEAER